MTILLSTIKALIFIYGKQLKRSINRNNWYGFCKEEDKMIRNIDGAEEVLNQEWEDSEKYERRKHLKWIKPPRYWDKYKKNDWGNCISIALGL